jgi:hypothetical protein
MRSELRGSDSTVNPLLCAFITIRITLRAKAATIAGDGLDFKRNRAIGGAQRA